MAEQSVFEVQRKNHVYLVGGLSAPVFNRRLLKGNMTISVAQSREAYYTCHRASLTGVSGVVNSLEKAGKLPE